MPIPPGLDLVFIAPGQPLDATKVAGELSYIESQVTPFSGSTPVTLSSAINFGIDVGTVNAPTVILAPAPVSVPIGFIVTFVTALANTGAVILNVNGTVGSLTTNLGTPLPVNTFESPCIVRAIRRATTWELLDVNGRNVPGTRVTNSASLPILSDTNNFQNVLSPLAIMSNTRQAVSTTTPTFTLATGLLNGLTAVNTVPLVAGQIILASWRISGLVTDLPAAPTIGSRSALFRLECLSAGLLMKDSDIPSASSSIDIGRSDVRKNDTSSLVNVMDFAGTTVIRVATTGSYSIRLVCNTLGGSAGGTTTITSAGLTIFS